MSSQKQRPKVEVRESEKFESGLEVVRRRDWPPDEWVAHIPEHRISDVLCQYVKFCDGKEVVSAEEAELLEVAREKLCQDSV